MFNQLASSTIPGSSVVTNIYNGEGLRVAKEVDGVIKRYLYEYDKVVLELDENGEVTARNVYGTKLLSRTLYVAVTQYMLALKLGLKAWRLILACQKNGIM